MKRKGFTLVEVALFIALTGLLFMGIVLGTGNSVAQQRFFDSTQSFAEFLRSIYSQVSNPQSIGSGRGDLAIYGKLISFGQCLDLDLKTSLCDASGNVTTQKVFVYDVVGDVKNAGSGTAVNMLKQIGASVVVLRDKNNKILNMRGERNESTGAWTLVVDGVPKRVEYAGIVDGYIPKWGATIETTEKRAGKGFENLYKGTILVVRNPASGTINTLVSSAVLNVNAEVKASVSGAKNLLWNLLAKDTSEEGAFKVQDVNFCINPNGTDAEASTRRDIRLLANARNASGVEIIDLDDFSTTGDGVKNECKR